MRLMGMRLLAIGDVHGCARALERLLERVAPTPTDVLVTLGDYVNKGHDARGALAALRRLRGETRLVALQGNHDLAFRRALLEGQEVYLRSFGHRTLASYGLDHLSAARFPREDASFLASLRPSFETPGHLFVHANADPLQALADQSPRALYLERLDPNQGPHGSGKTLVCGHTAQPGGRVLDLDHTLGLDTDACGGGWLSCMDLNSGWLWQANEAGQTREGARGDPGLFARAPEPRRMR